MATYRQRVAQYYNAKVKPKVFHPRNLVLRKTEVSKSLDQKKLSPNQERPYKVIETLHLGAYRLKTLDAATILQIWNVDNLKIYYQ